MLLLLLVLVEAHPLLRRALHVPTVTSRVLIIATVSMGTAGAGSSSDVLDKMK